MIKRLFVLLMLLVATTAHAGTIGTEGNPAFSAQQILNNVPSTT